MPTKQELEYYYANNTIKELEKKYNVGQSTIYDWFNNYNIEMRSLSESCVIGKKYQHQEKYFDYDIIKNIYSKYKDYELCANKLNISVSHFRKLKDQYEIKTIDNFRSKMENELYEYIKHYDNDVLSNDRKLIKPYELDILSHKYKLAIEYCGLYWHSETYGTKDKNYHKMKKELCEEQGYKLLTIFESDNIEKVKNLIDYHCKQVNKIYARNCELKIINKEIAKEFHQLYHIHGYVGSSLHLGLYYNNDCVMICSFGKSRFNKNYQYECTRMSSKINVIGGASKLIKYFIKNISNSFIVYADLRYGSGKVYEKCGLTELKRSPPNYWYFNKNNPIQLYSRVNFQKHKLKNIFENFDLNKTEYNNMLNNGWDRIWDCGNAVYIYKK